MYDRHSTSCLSCDATDVHSASGHRGLTDESLGGHTEPVEGPGWPESRSYPVRECLLVVLNEEWEHRLYAERDLALLEAGSSLRCPLDLPAELVGYLA